MKIGEIGKVVVRLGCYRFILLKQWIRFTA